MERNPVPAYRERVFNSEGSEVKLAYDYYLSAAESDAGEVSVGSAVSAGAALESVVAGAVTLLVVWPDTGPCLSGPQQPSPQPAIPIAENTANAATVFSHSRLIRGLR